MWAVAAFIIRFVKRLKFSGFGGIEQYRTFGPSIRVCQLNVEGLSRAKCDYLGKYLAKHNIDALALKETHIANQEKASKLLIPGFHLVANQHHPKYGLATFVKHKLKDLSTSDTNNRTTNAIVTKIGKLTLINVYKPTNLTWTLPIMPVSKHPTIYIGDFNSHHTMWGYPANDTAGEQLADWA